MLCDARTAAITCVPISQAAAAVNSVVMITEAGRPLCGWRFTPAKASQIRVQFVDGTPLRLMLNLAVAVVAAVNDTDPHTLVAAFRGCPSLTSSTWPASSSPHQPIWRSH
jgi:hypothetical protein